MMLRVKDMYNEMYETAAERALDLVTDLGLKASLSDDRCMLMIDRTSMCQNFPSNGDEHKSYQQIRDFLNSEFEGYRVMWQGRTDDWLGAVFYKKVSRI